VPIIWDGNENGDVVTEVGDASDVPGRSVGNHWGLAAHLAWSLPWSTGRPHKLIVYRLFMLYMTGTQSVGDRATEAIRSMRFQGLVR
jgi:hypothetical protein